MRELLDPFRHLEAAVLWESVKFDGSPNRSARAIDLGTTQDGRWLFIAEGTRVTRPGTDSYDHPCDAIALIPVEGLWTATWLVDWEPSLYVDIAQLREVADALVLTVDLDVDVTRHADGSVEVLDEEEFEQHRRTLGYPIDLVRAVSRATAQLAERLRAHDAPFGTVPPVLQRRDTL